MPWTWSTLTYLCDLFPTQHRRSAGPASIFVSIRQISKALAFPRSFAAPSINSWRQWWNHPRQLQLNHLLCFTFLTQKPKVEIRWNTHVSERVISPSPLSRNSSGSLGTSRNIVASCCIYPMRTHIILTREQYSKAEVCTPDNLGEPTPWYEMVWTLLANCWTNHTKEIARTCQNEARWPCSNLPSKLNSVFIWSDEKETARNHATYCDWWLYNTVYLLELLPVLKRITQSCTRSSYCKSNSFAQRVIVETDWGASTWSVSRNLRIALPKITGASACWLEVLKCGRLGWHALADYKWNTSMEYKMGCRWKKLWRHTNAEYKSSSMLTGGCAISCRYVSTLA